jgi:hypothetical protein
MSQFMSEVHEPSEVMPEFRQQKKQQENCISGKTAKETSQIAFYRSIHPHPYSIITE